MFEPMDINNINDMPHNPELDGAGEPMALSSSVLSAEDLVARAKASILAVGAHQEQDPFDLPSSPSESHHFSFQELKPEQESAPFVARAADEQRAEPQQRVEPSGSWVSSSVAGIEDQMEAEAEIKVRVKTGDLLYTRADLMVRRDNHLSAVVDGVLLDLGMINVDLMNAMALAHQVHVSAGHYLGGIIERRVPLVHQ